MKQLMLIHGALGGADQLIPLKDLLKEDFKIHLLEFEGHGKKAAAGSSFSLESFEQQFSKALSKIDGPVHIFGYSMGGFIALLHTANDNKLIYSITTLGTKMKWSQVIAEKETKNLNAAVIAEKVPWFAEALKKRHGDYWQDVMKRTADFMKELGEIQPVQESAMKKIEIPVQLCLAENDAMVSIAETQQYKNG